MADAAGKHAFLVDRDVAVGRRSHVLGLRASEEDYRKLIHYLPVALWQVDTRGASAAFDQLKAEGVTDIAAYLDEHPELVEHAKDIVRVTAVNREAIALFRGTSAADLVAARPLPFRRHARSCEAGHGRSLRGTAKLHRGDQESPPSTAR